MSTQYTVAGGRVYFDALPFPDAGVCTVELSVDSWSAGDVCRFGVDFLPAGSEIWQELSSGETGPRVNKQGEQLTVITMDVQVPEGASVRPWVEPLQDFSTTVTAKAV